MDNKPPNEFPDEESSIVGLNVALEVQPEQWRVELLNKMGDTFTLHQYNTKEEAVAFGRQFAAFSELTLTIHGDPDKE